jgi:hypothetical protein
MVRSLIYKQVLRFVKFPVYKLPSEDYYERDGLVFIDDLVVDDRNQNGETLGQRRLQTPHKLKQLNTSYSDYIDLVSENPYILIDNGGNIFHYHKTKFETVRSYKIKKKEPKETHTRIWLRGVNFAFIVPRPPTGKQWAQVLTFNNRPWLLYSFSEEKLPEFRRKI